MRGDPGYVPKGCMLRDNIKARDQLPDGTYVRRTVPETEEALNAQEYFLACAYVQK